MADLATMHKATRFGAGTQHRDRVMRTRCGAIVAGFRVALDGQPVTCRRCQECIRKERREKYIGEVTRG